MFPRPINPTWVFKAIDLVETRKMETIILIQELQVTAKLFTKSTVLVTCPSNLKSHKAHLPYLYVLL